VKFNNLILLIFLFSLACKEKKETTFATEGSITESVYTTGTLKSKDQYQAFATVSGFVSKIFVTEGDIVKKGQPLLSISNQTQRLQEENAALTAEFADFNLNKDRIKEAELQVELSFKKKISDSLLFARQKVLWQQKIGSRVEYEQRELAYFNSNSAYLTSKIKLQDLNRQLKLASLQSKKNLSITKQLAKEFTVLSQIDGQVFNILKTEGDLVGPQTPLAVIGKARDFVLEMQVDEFDIFKIKEGMPVVVSMDSYKGQAFQAKLSRIIPIMNERNKAFLVEAFFVDPPERLFPNITFEANIVLQTKEKALLVPRRFFVNDSTLVNRKGEAIRVKIGLKDFQKAEILEGLSAKEEIMLPKP